MMRIPNNFYIKCNECGNVTLVEADDLDYETSVYDRPMGEEIEYDFRGEICCDKCHSWIDFSIRGYAEKKCLSPAKKYKLYKISVNKSIYFAQKSLSSSTRG